MKFIIIIVIVLVIIAAAQLMKMYEFSSRLRNKDEADVTPSETKFNAGMMLLFYLVLMISSTYLFIVYGGRPGLGPSASEHGQEVDFLYDANWVIILIVYYITQTLLFGFAIKYQQKKGRKAVFFAHSTKLEMIWTIIPAVVLAGIIIGGLTVWNKITAPKENATVIEIYAKQFDWTVRYSGEDNTLGNSDFKLIDGANPLGVISTDLISSRIYGWSKESIEIGLELNVLNLDSKLMRTEIFKDIHDKDSIVQTPVELMDSIKNIYNGFQNLKLPSDMDIFLGKNFEEYSKNISELATSNDYQYLADNKFSDLSKKHKRLNRQIRRLSPLKDAQTEESNIAANDDVIVKELYLIKGQEYEFKFRSRDVIHSALFPQFRAQMNCVPGMVTRFSFKPILTTAEMRNNPVIVEKYKKLNKKRAAEGKEEVEFNYLLLCNKICGSSHYKMQLNIVVVESQDDFDKWYSAQKPTNNFPVLAGLVVPKAKDEKADSNLTVIPAMSDTTK